MTELTGRGDSIRGEWISAEASEISNVRVDTRSSTHRGQFVKLKFNAYCVIDTPMRWVLEKTNKK